MTPQEAIQILDQAAAMAPLNRQSHIAVQEALNILRELLRKKQDDSKDKQEKK